MMRRIFIFPIISIFFLAGCKVQDVSTSAKNPAPFGVNLAGAEFGKIDGGEYGYPTPYELDYFKSKGLTLFRLPFKWERIQPEMNAELDSVELAGMIAFVDAARDRGLLIILDMHNYGRRYIDGKHHIIGSPEVSIADVADAWRRLADEFKDYDNIWAYGIMNEPHDMREDTPWFDIAQEIINSIREVDTKNAIAVGGDSWSSADRWLEQSDNLKNLSDPANNLIFEGHVYFDHDASGAYRGSYDEEGATPTIGIERVAPFVTWLKKHNFRGFVGEYGVPHQDPRWLEVLDNMLDYMQSNGVNGTYWAAGPRWGTYKLAVQPRNGEDRPQMKVLEKYLYAESPKGKN